ncbi:MAG: ankyrin repeat domain-containing protein, partial [Phycisphaerales bacterium JB064]
DGTMAVCPECGWTTGRRPRLRLRGIFVMAIAMLILLMFACASLVTMRFTSVESLPALHHAAAVGDTETVRALLDAGESVDAVAPRLSVINTSALQQARAIDWAAAHGHAGVVRRLLDAGADPGMVGTQASPLSLAMAGDHHAVVDMLLDAGASVTERPSVSLAPIAIAVLNEDMPLLERMFEIEHAHSGAAVNLGLMSTVLANRPPSVQDMVLERTRTTPQIEAGLGVFAFRMGDIDLLDAMINRGFDPSAASSYFIGYLTQARDIVAAIDVLHARGVDLGATVTANLTALHLVASEADAPEAIARLLELGVPLEATDTNGRTALHWAASTGHTANVRALLDAGANADAKDQYDNTPRDLWWHSARGRDDTAEIREMLEAAQSGPP